MSAAAFVWTLAVLLQEAVDILVGASVPAHSRRVFKAWPQSGLSLCWPTVLRKSPAPYTVHEMPHIVWRRTLSFDDTSDVHRGSWSDLADAALALLGNNALDEAAKRPQQQQQQHCQSSDCQMVPCRQRKKHSPSARGNWEAFVQECLRSKSTVVAATELLDHGQQLAQQVSQRVGQQVGQQVGQDGGQEVVYGHQQSADDSSSLNCPFKCQVRLKLKSDSNSHSLCM